MARTDILEHFSEIKQWVDEGQSKAQLALCAHNTSTEFNHLFDIHFCIKGTHLYQLSQAYANSATCAYKISTAN